ncbi:hypothetical protein Leryth_024249 [Lithospermum erythrorhizon]|nr:hypothetical protein Leryth_024249 [Lithospermum erythrorhizon]
MGTEYPARPSYPPRSAATPFSVPRSTTPFSSSGPVVGTDSSTLSSNPPPPAPRSFQLSAPPSSSATPVGSSGAARPPASYGPPTTGPFQRPPNPPMPSPPVRQIPPPPAPFSGQPTPPPTITTASSLSPPVSFPPQSQPPSVPMGPPRPLMGSMQPNLNGPSLESSYSAPRSNVQSFSSPLLSPYPPSSDTPQNFPGYPSNQPSAMAQGPPVMPSGFATQQIGYIPPPAATASFRAHQGGYFPTGTTPQRPAPPMASVQGLAEDFNSLSLSSVPGSYDSRLDPQVLPRPLDGDIEPKFPGQDYEVNCSSRFLRLTTNTVPSSQSLASRWHLPLGAVVCPLAEGEEVPIVNFGVTGIIRCRRCRTYVNPFVVFMDSGRKWKCNICSLLNDVPGDYFAHLDASGKRVDLDQRPELRKGSVEFIAPTEYMVRPPMPPSYFFLIDVSISAVKSGMLQVVAQTIKSSLDSLPGFPRTQIGFITYDSVVQFYEMKSSLSQPRMMVISDLDDIFVPLPDDLLVNLSESRNVVDAFLDSLPSMFQDNINVESAFGPALKSAFMVMSQLGGKLLIFQHTMPSLGPGRLRLRGDDLRTHGTEKEHTLRSPEDPFYKQMAADFTKYQIAVNVYAFSDKYIDIATLGTLAKYTGGQVYYYPSFQASIHGDKLKYELNRDLTRETAWEAVMRIRCGKGLRFTSYHGNFMLRSTDLLALPASDCDKAYAMQLSLEETILTTSVVHFQVALLYTSSSGERRIRVHTAAAPVVTDLSEMYRFADTGAIVSVLSRLAIEKTLTSKLEEGRIFIQQKIVKSLREYRNLYAAQQRLGGQMIYPESLKFLVLYGLALWKSTPLRGGQIDVPLDERCSVGSTMMALPVTKLLKLLYPNLTRIDEYLLKTSPQVDASSNILKRLPVSAESLDSRGLYIYDNGFQFVLWFGRMLSPDMAMNLLGQDFTADYSKTCSNSHTRHTSLVLGMGLNIQPCVEPL